MEEIESMVHAIYQLVFGEAPSLSVTFLEQLRAISDGVSFLAKENPQLFNGYDSDMTAKRTQLIVVNTTYSKY